MHSVDFLEEYSNFDQLNQNMTTWDPEKVLSLVETWYPLEDLPFPKMSKKLAILLTLRSGFRVQSLASILLKDIKITNKEVEIRIFEIIKTSKPGAPQPTAVFPFFKEKKSVFIAEPGALPEDYERQKK